VAGALAQDWRRVRLHLVKPQTLKRCTAAQFIETAQKQLNQLLLFAPELRPQSNRVNTGVERTILSSCYVVEIIVPLR
jgi:hypothetical protein